MLLVGRITIILRSVEVDTRYHVFKFHPKSRTTRPSKNLVGGILQLP